MINLTDAATVSTSFKPTYTSGLIPAKLLALNPTPEEYLELTGSEPRSFEMEYDVDGGKKLKALISYENAFGRTEYTFVNYFDLKNELTLSAVGNKQFIDSKGNSTWNTTSDNAAEKLSKGEIRHGRKGEEGLLQLLVMQLNWRYDDVTKNIFKVLEEKKCFKKAGDLTTFDFASWNKAIKENIHPNGLDVAVFMYSKTTHKGDKTFINVVAERASIEPYYRLKNATFVLKGLSKNWAKDEVYKNIPSNFAAFQVGWKKSDNAGFIPFKEKKVGDVEEVVVEKKEDDDLPF